MVLHKTARLDKHLSLKSRTYDVELKTVVYTFGDRLNKTKKGKKCQYIYQRLKE